MNQKIIIRKNAEKLAEENSKDFMNLYFSMIELFQKYFLEQSLEYIEKLDGNISLQKMSKEEILEELKKLLQEAYKLGNDEEIQNLLFQLMQIGETQDLQILDSTYSLEYAEKTAGALITGINETTQTIMSGIITAGMANSKSIHEIAKDIKSKFSDFSLYRASLIAQQEISMAYSNGRKKQFESFAKDLGIIGYKRAITQKDSKVRPSHKINEEDGWIRQDKAYSGTGTLNAPHGIFCRCRDSYSLVNPETGLLDNVNINLLL